MKDNWLRLVMVAFAVLLPATILLSVPEPVSAATFTVTFTTDNTTAGSLRWAITQANLNPGTDNITFNIPPTDPGYYTENATSHWWRIELLDDLPEITDPITIDGTTQTINQGNTNPGKVGTGGTVGIDSLALPTYDRPEIELTKSAPSVKNGLVLQANNVTVKGLAIYGFGTSGASLQFAQIQVLSGSSILIDNCLIGVRANGADPGFDSKSCGIYISSGTSGSVTNNFVGHNIMGIQFEGASNWLLTRNEAFRNALRYDTNDGIDMAKSSSNITLRGNLIRENGGMGIDSTRSGGPFIIENNTVLGNGIGNRETAGIRLHGTNNTINKNIVSGNRGPGILIPSDTGAVINENTVISQNSCYANGGLGIDLARSKGGSDEGDGVNFNDGIYNSTYGNNGMDFPVITSSSLVGNSLTLSGYVGTDNTSTLFKNSTLEFFKANPDPTGYGEGQTYLGSYIMAGATNSFSCTIDVTGKGLTSSDHITATARDSSGNTSEFSLSVQLAAIPVLTLELTPPAYGFAGQNITFTGTVRNSSNAIADNAILIWQLPIGFTYVSSSHAAVYNPVARTVTFLLGNLSPGAEVSGWITLGIDAAIADGTILTTSAALSWYSGATPYGPLIRNLSVVIYAAPTLNLSVSPLPDTCAGQNVMFTGILSNPSNGTAYNTVLVWQISDNITFVSSSHTAIYDPISDNVTWNLGNLSPGASISGWMTVNIGAGIPDGTILYTSTFVSWKDYLGNDYGPAQQQHSLIVRSKPEITITKEGPSEAIVGSDVTYTGTLTNEGCGAADNVTLIDYLPVGLSFVSSSQSAVYNPANRTITWSLGTVNSSASISGWVTVHIDNTVSNRTQLINNFQVTWNDGIGNSYGPASVTQQLTAYTNPSITITKQGPTEAKVGGSVTYTGTLTNIGGDTANNVTLVDYLPAGMSFISSSHNAVYNAANRTITWSLGSVGTGIAIPGWVTLGIDSSVANGSRLANTFQVTWEGGAGIHYGPVSASHELIAYTNPYLTVSKTGPDYGHPGDTLNYTINVSNLGGSGAQNVVVTDFLATKFNYISSVPAGTYNAGTGTVTWNLGTLASGGSSSFSIVVQADNTTANNTQLTNLAAANWSDAQGNSYGPVSGSATTNIITVPQLAISKTGPATAIPGDNCTFTILVTNIGGSNADNVTIVDMIPTKMSYISSVPAGVSDNSTVIWNLGTIASGGSNSLSVTLSVDGTITQETTLINTASGFWKDQLGTSFGPTGGLATLNVYPHPITTLQITGSTTVAKGATATYTLIVTNPSTSTAFNVILQGSLPIGFQYVSSQPPGTFSNGVVTWNIGNLAPGSSAQVTVTIVVADSAVEGSTLILTGADTWQSPIGTTHGPSFATLPIIISTAPPPPPPPPPPPQEASPAQSAPRKPSYSYPQWEPPTYKIMYLNINPQQTTAGQPVTILTNVVNTGDEAGNYNVILKINGQVEQSRMVSVGPKGTQPVKFMIIKDQPGTYTVNIGDQKASFIVTGAARGSSAGMAEGILFAVATAVIAVLIILLIIVVRRRLQDYSR